MTYPDAPGAVPEPYYHADSEALRFWVSIPDRAPIGAILGKRVLQHRFLGQADGSDALAVYAANRLVIDAAVARRTAGGSLEPVMLREYDLPLSPR